MTSLNCRRAGFRTLAVFACLGSSAALFVNGCRRGDQGASEAITIGVVLPISGREAKPGQYQKEGIELAIKQINDHGGILVKQKGKRLPVKEVFYDDGSDQAKSANLLERAMSSDGVTAALGGYSTALGQAESVMPDRYRTPWISTGAAASAIFNHGYEYIFGTLSPTTLLGSTTAEFLGAMVDQGKLRKGSKLALAVENTDHGVDYVAGIEQWIQNHPGYFEVAFNEKFELGSPDFSGLLQKIKASRADVLLADAHLQDYITMHRQYLQSGMHHALISYGARGPESDARKALGEGTNYIFAGIWWSKRLPYPQVRQFVADYRQFAGHEPDSWYPATAYDAMRALAQAIELAGTTDKPAIRDALRQVELKDSLLPGGVLKFGANGQVGNPFVIVQNRADGEADIVYPKDAATGQVIAPAPRS